jgi:uncharacterized membrane protein YphA (DoxX/SURF4 family)
LLEFETRGRSTNLEGSKGIEAGNIFYGSADYLEGSYGFLSGFYHALAGSQSLLHAVDFLNVWGLILIGLGLFLGVFSRISAVSGIILLILYYFAYPPFGLQNLLMTQEGHFWIVNRNLFEALALTVVCFFPAEEYSMINIFRHFRKKPEEKPAGEIDSNKRRQLIKGLITIPFLGGVVYKAASESGMGINVSSGADFICVGMFDFQVVENANLVIDILKSDLNRKRPWYS